MFKATIYSTIFLGLLSASTKGSQGSSSLSKRSPKPKPTALQTTRQQSSNFVIITPPVTWKSAEKVCNLNGYNLARLNEDNLQIAVDLVNEAKYNGVWIDSYMGHGSGGDAAVMLRSGKSGPGCSAKPSTINIMRTLKAQQCSKTYPVLCSGKKRCESTESSSSVQKCPKQKNKKTPKKAVKKKCKKEVKKKCPSSSSSSSQDYSTSTSSRTLSTYTLSSDSWSDAYSSTDNTYSQSYSDDYSTSYSDYSDNYTKDSSSYESATSTTSSDSDSSSSASSGPSTIIEINIISSKKKKEGKGVKVIKSCKKPKH